MVRVVDNNVETGNEKYTIVLTFAGEGLYGDYDEDIPDDCPLIRANVYDKNDDTECIASTCTGVDANISIEEAKEYAETILREISTSVYNVETALSMAV